MITVIMTAEVSKMADYIICNGKIVNGKNEAPFEGNIIIEGSRIKEITKTTELPSDFPTERILDAKGGYVTPGFIDIHRHGDWQALENGDDELLNRQGLTTVVNGNCGLSVAPVGTEHQKEILGFISSVTGNPPEKYIKEDKSCPAAESFHAYMDALKATKRSVNTGMLAGNGTIRACAAGYRTGSLAKEELRTAWKQIEESLDAGALGISLGIAYAPEFEYDKKSLIEVLSPLKDTGIPITTHVRSEGDSLIESQKEVLHAAKVLHIPLHISHVKCIGKKNWGTKCEEALQLFAQARAEGVQLDFDLYPYLTGSTQLVHVLPPECQKGGTDEIIRRLKDRTYRKHLTEVLKTPSDEFENIVELAGFDQIYASTLHTEKYKAYAGKTIQEIADFTGNDPYDTLYDILIEENCQVTMLDTIASEEDMLHFLKDEYANLISDAIYPAGGKYHPRVYAAFPKVLTDYVRDRQIFTIEEAVYKMTGRAAKPLHLDRGVLEAGKAADINIFHLENLKVKADFDDPDQFCEGFDYVLTGGKIAVRDDRWTNTGSGEVLVRK